MLGWPTKPFIYEINTSVWLNNLSKRYGHPITLANVPDEVINELAAYNVDAIWLMGVWQRSTAARKSALNYIHEYENALPDIEEEDVLGSAYAIGDYQVDQQFGGREALATFRSRLQYHDLKLILDFVPNHIATDHSWVTEKPHFMVRGTHKAMKDAPDTFFLATNEQGQELVIGHGRDPYFPGWIDTAQINAFSLEGREAMRETLLDIASQCDGVRCDMAMLMINDIFKQTWGTYLAETAPKTEYWEDIIPLVKQQHPGFAFIAEVYWDMEHILLQQGFDMTYDKQLYDRIQNSQINDIRDHLSAPFNYQQRQVRFIENHDEHRAAASMGIEKGRAAATLICTLPGTVLLHDGQFTAKKIKLPVQIQRQPEETTNHALAGFYHKLLKETRSEIYQHGTWRLFEIEPSYPNNETNENIIAYGWTHKNEFRIIVANLTPTWSQGIAKVYGWDHIRDGYWRLFDVLGAVCTYRDGNRIADEGLYVELEAFQSQIFYFEQLDGHNDLEYIRRVDEMRW
jgi:glycosidase